MVKIFTFISQFVRFIALADLLIGVASWSRSPGAATTTAATTVTAAADDVDRQQRSSGKNLILALKKAVPISHVVRKYEEVERQGSSGSQHRARCVFHNDKSPSMHLTDGPNLFHCFACGASGDTYGYLQRVKNCTFGEAVNTLRSCFEQDFLPSAVVQTATISTSSHVSSSKNTLLNKGKQHLTDQELLMLLKTERYDHATAAGEALTPSTSGRTTSPSNNKPLAVCDRVYCSNMLDVPSSIRSRKAAPKTISRSNTINTINTIASPGPEPESDPPLPVNLGMPSPEGALRALDAATRYYCKHITAGVREYMRLRGIRAPVVKQFSIGFQPPHSAADDSVLVLASPMSGVKRCRPAAVNADDNNDAKEDIEKYNFEKSLSQSIDRSRYHFSGNNNSQEINVALISSGLATEVLFENSAIRRKSASGVVISSPEAENIIENSGIKKSTDAIRTNTWVSKKRLPEHVKRLIASGRVYEQHSYDIDNSNSSSNNSSNSNSSNNNNSHGDDYNNVNNKDEEALTCRDLIDANVVWANHKPLATAAAATEGDTSSSSSISSIPMASKAIGNKVNLQCQLVDRFSSRIMFPIRSVVGRVVGFGARVIPQQEVLSSSSSSISSSSTFHVGDSHVSAGSLLTRHNAVRGIDNTTDVVMSVEDMVFQKKKKKSVAKYINSPASHVFSKRHTLYGLDVARSYIEREGYAIIVEGYMDVLALHSMGFKNAIGSMGTAITIEQLLLIANSTNKNVAATTAAAATADTPDTSKIPRRSTTVVLMLDGDEAGTAAGERVQKLVARWNNECLMKSSIGSRSTSTSSSSETIIVQQTLEAEANQKEQEAVHIPHFINLRLANISHASDFIRLKEKTINNKNNRGLGGTFYELKSPRLDNEASQEKEDATEFPLFKDCGDICAQLRKRRDLAHKAVWAAIQRSQVAAVPPAATSAPHYTQQ